MNILLVSLVLIASMFCDVNKLYSQDLPTFEFNQTDESGLRTGIWVEEDYYNYYKTKRF
jgi:hypothetical protein